MRGEDLEPIFREHHAAVFRTGYRVTGNASDAEDVLQTVFLRLARRGGDAAAVENLPAYLHRAAVNAALDVMRARQGIHDVPLDDVAPVLAAPAQERPDRAHAAGEIREWLRKALARLHPRTAEMFVLRFFEDLDNQEIARQLDTTPGTVAVTLSRARDRLEQDYRGFAGGAA
jgi:RNA polymerase sigma-70 factor (ECF subfamily)